ncbi:MAG: TIR domain-containing protein [Anaerolineae bacterium]|nr:TIR domain-containing protein [Anaerolineae bacterium]
MDIRTPTNDLFISYSRRNKEFVIKLHAELVKTGRSIWVDWEDIPKAAEWWEEIKSGIESADAFVFILSPDSARSKVCGEEVQHAVQHNKRLIPIVFQEVSDPQDRALIHPQIGDHNWIFFTDPANFDPAFSDLVRALDTDLEYVREHTRLLMRANEWHGQNRDSSYLLRGLDLEAAELWLTTSTAKSPTATALQAEYVLASRRAASRYQRRLLSLTAGALLVMVVLAFLAAISLVSARSEANLRATQERIALRNADLADSRRLAVQALSALDDGLIDRALLLSLESGNIADTLDAQGSLLDSLLRNPLLTRIFYSDSAFNTLAINPSGTIMAIAYGDDSIRFWDTVTLQPFGDPLLGHNDTIYQLTFSPDGATLASASQDGTVHLWEVRSRKLIQVLDPFERSPLRTVAFSPDGQLIAAGGETARIVIWQAADPSFPLTILTGHTDRIWRIVFHPNGRQMASSAEDFTVRFWNVRDQIITPAAFAVPSIHDNWVVDLAYSPDGTRLASAGADNLIVIWDTLTGLPIGRPLVGHTGIVWRVAFNSQNPAQLVSVGADQQVFIWDLMTRRGTAHTGHTEQVRGAIFLPDGQSLYTAGRDRRMILWDVTGQNTLSQDYSAHQGRVYDLAINASGTVLYSVSDDTTLRRWSFVDLTDSTVLLTAPRGLLALALVSDDQALLGDINGTIFLYDLAQTAILGTLDGHTEGIFDLAISSTGQFASASIDGTIRLWDNATLGAESRILTGHTEAVQTIAFSPDGRYLASGGQDQQVILWDTETGEILHRLTVHQGDVERVIFSPDGTILATGARDRLIYLWDLSALPNMITEIGLPLIGNSDWVLDLVFSPDGSTLYSSSRSGDILLWSVQTGLTLGEPLHYSDWVWSLAIQPDGQTISAGLNDGRVAFWNINADEWRLRACQIANRNLTPEEWVRFMPDKPYRETCPG